MMNLEPIEIETIDGVIYAVTYDGSGRWPSKRVVTPNDAANLQMPECQECGAPYGQAHDPLCIVR